ncbi:MAG: hypothetical protein P1U56_21700 [Saprospiraceae bacterium]|nr:hypothetical protein [Saprospiraceae bacterium]
MIKLFKIWTFFGLYSPAWLYDKLGNYLFVNRQFEQANTLYEMFQAKHPNSPYGLLGQVRIARTLNKWEAAVEKLEKGIQKHPKYLDFYVQKINVLILINKLKDAKQTVELAKKNQPPHLSLVFAESKLYQKELDYESAQQVLNKGLEKFPNNVELSIRRGHNFWCLGNHESAKESLYPVKHQVDPTQNELFTKFSTPYIYLLLQDNNLKALKHFFEEATAAGILNKEIVFGYSQLLIGQGEYSSAITFNQHILDSDESSLTFNQKILLQFELKKAKNLNDWSKGPQRLMSPKYSSMELFSCLNTIEKELVKNPKLVQKDHIVFKLFHSLRICPSVFPHTYLNTTYSIKEANTMLALIIQSIQNKSPFSMIRLGDGEGAFLPYEKEKSHFQNSDRELSQHIWWGDTKINEKEWIKIQNHFMTSIKNADVLGIPDVWRCCKTFLSIPLDQKMLNPEGRGLAAIFNFVEKSWLKSPEENLSKNLPILTSCHIHTHFTEWNIWDIILKKITSCSVISCHSALIPLLKEKHQVTVRSFHHIPSEYKYAQLFDQRDKHETSHYPEIFEQICANITVAYPGEVYLVAAGFLGKIYCNLIKQKGGIALDVGSAVDYWLDYKTRVWTKFPSSINMNNES